MDIMFLDAFEKMGRSKKDLKRVDFPLKGFAGESILNPIIIELNIQKFAHFLIIS